jgi:hypothetical protein
MGVLRAYGHDQRQAQDQAGKKSGGGKESHGAARSNGGGKWEERRRCHASVAKKPFWLNEIN